MKPVQILMDQMISYISFQAHKLDDFRLGMFLKWLRSHSSAVRNATSTSGEVESQNKEIRHDYLNTSLKLWFESLPVPGLIWEYQLILTEIRWWRALDERSLDRILKEDAQD